MPALSFQEMWLDALLSGRKKQTTRATDRIKVGHVCSIYNEQRKQITAKPLRKLTIEGDEMMREREYPRVRKLPEGTYYAHFLGKVKIIDVHSMIPSEMSWEDLEAWAWADGFDGFSRVDPFGDEHKINANEWFTKQYGDNWMDRTWYVIRWGGWLERYFLADGEPKKAGD